MHNLSWPLVDGHLSLESTKKVETLQLWARQPHSERDLLQFMVHLQERLYPKEDPTDKDLSPTERRWRHIQREDFRTVYVRVLEMPDQGLRLLEEHAKRLISYEDHISQLAFLEDHAKGIAIESKDVRVVTVDEAWQAIGKRKWRLLMPAAGLKRAVRLDLKSAMPNATPRIYTCTAVGLLTLNPEAKVVLYRNKSTDPAVRQLAYRHAACLTDIAQVHLRLCRTYRVWVALKIWTGTA